MQVIVFAFQQAHSVCIQGSWMSCLRYHSGVILLWEEPSTLVENDDKTLSENESGSHHWQSSFLSGLLSPLMSQGGTGTRAPSSQLP